MNKVIPKIYRTSKKESIISKRIFNNKSGELFSFNYQKGHQQIVVKRKKTIKIN